uniref:Uncharacterized protein n=1 Tax=Daphnia galeata TaxID=27404 RepID=A0A8J2WTF4_9CRUS|nr:unnamed protein product [Daphnia galeata]
MYKTEDATPFVLHFTDNETQMSEAAGYSYVDRLTQLEEDLFAQGQYIKEESHPFYRMPQFKKPQPEAQELARKAARMLEAAQYLKIKMSLPNDEFLRQTTSNFTVINKTCLAVITCPTASKYRTIDGSYSNIQTPRAASNGSALPSARLVSTVVFGGADRALNTTTLALMQFGQLINHDFQSTTQFTFTNGSDISCCTSTGGTLNASQLHPACLPISVPTNDRFWNVNATIITTCMNFIRSMAGPRLDCSIGYADQLNQNTHWLDASTLYGSSTTTAALVRNFTGGLLKTTSKDVISATVSRDLLPISSPCTTAACFYAGPAIITKHSLAPLTTGFLTRFNQCQHQQSDDRPDQQRIRYRFATAAFRFGHSLVQGSVKLYAEDGSLLNTSYTMSDTFNDPSRIVTDKTYFDAVIRGLLTQPSQSIDQNVDDSLWNRPFRAKNIRFDIVALNIQRGRDHGLPSYNTYRQLCGFTKVTSFSGLNATSTTNPVIPTLRVDKSCFNILVDDIDVYVGGLAEIPLTGSIAGPTLNCLIAEQFNQIKFSDRYFYELGNQAHSFTAAQLTEIRKASLARIFCDNSDQTVLTAQPKAFVPVSSTILVREELLRLILLNYNPLFFNANAKVLCTATCNHHPFFEFEAMGKRDPVLIIGIIYPSSRQLPIFT